MLAEPTSAISALCMSVIVIWGPPRNKYQHIAKLPVVFWLAQCALFSNGIGSFIFHGTHPEKYEEYAINPRLLDGLSLALMNMFMVLLFINPSNNFAASYLLLFYVQFVVYSNDSLSYPRLYDDTNGTIAMGIQFPIMALMYIFLIRKVTTSYPWKETRVCLFCLGVAVLSWCIDRFVCSGQGMFSFFHMFWHVFSAYGSLLLMCFGLRKNNVALQGLWWPEITSVVLGQDSHSFWKNTQLLHHVK
jgi:hypothetical protein